MASFFEKQCFDGYFFLSLTSITDAMPWGGGHDRIFDRHLQWREGKFILPWKVAADKLGFRDVCSGLDSFWKHMKQL